jgi:hypothetical protein
MGQTPSVFAHSTQFDQFLHASIGEDDHGMLLSVLSALARLGLDPWQEAAKLAQLPADAAAQKLAALLAALPQASVAYLDPAALADRLTRLLPRGAKADAAPGETPSRIQSLFKPSAIAVFFIVMAIMLCAQYVLRASH